MRAGCAFLVAVSALALAGPAAAATASRTDLSLTAAAFARPSATSSSGARALGYLPGQGLVSWRRGEATSVASARHGFVDSLRIDTATLPANPAAALMRPGADAISGRQAYELTYTRNWPAALSAQRGRLSFDITPHAGLGLDSVGGQLAEAGALLRLGRAMDVVGARDVLEGSRLYLFAGLNGRAVGLDMLNDRRKAPHSDGFVREAQAGLGFSRGGLTASLGYTHERIRLRALGGETRGKDRLGLIVSLRPGR